MKHATRVLVPYSDISEHIPHKWRDRVKVKIIESILPHDFEEDLAPRPPKNTSLIIAEVPHVDLEDPYKETWDFVSEYGDNSRDVAEPLGMESTSPCIPGAIVVDPLLREAAEKSGLKVTNNAIWILVVALREHTKNVLKNSMVLKKALESGQVYPPALHYPNVLAFSTKKDGKQQDKPSAPVKQSGPKRLINSMDILSAAERLPSGQIGSFGGSVSRLSLEQSFQTAFNAIPSCLADKKFREVQRFVTDELFSAANHRKFDSSKRADDPPISTRTRPPQSPLPSGPQIIATYPQPAPKDTRNPSVTAPEPSLGGQASIGVLPGSKSTQSNIAMQNNRSAPGENVPSAPMQASVSATSAGASRREVPFGQLDSSKPEDQDTRQPSSSAQYLVPRSSAAPPLPDVQTLAGSAPDSFQPPVTKDVKASAHPDGPREAPLMASSHHAQVRKDVPLAETTRGAQRPVIRGMGRGAKDLAALMSRTASAASTSLHSSESSPPVASPAAAAAATPASTQKVENVGGGGEMNSDRNAIDNVGSDSHVAKSAAAVATTTVSGEVGVRGKGFGTKDLAAMRARAAGGSPSVDRTPRGEGAGEAQHGSDAAQTRSVCNAGEDTRSNST